ncbi:hypothetical protein LZ31DRAFT_50909 [Colletotrichum somersetense]|nr:hypothetical protein LZ31DRAFT_50909 [Colletotrichum somersetense]
MSERSFNIEDEHAHHLIWYRKQHSQLFTVTTFPIFKYPTYKSFHPLYQSPDVLRFMIPVLNCLALSSVFFMPMNDAR